VDVVSATDFSLQEQIECVEREISYRRRVYARLVQTERMKQWKADAEIACMESVLATLQRLAPPPPEQSSLL
jgi:hypothetical protein